MFIQFKEKVIEFHSMEIKHEEEQWGQYPFHTYYYVHRLYINDRLVATSEDINLIAEKYTEILKALSENKELYIWNSLDDNYVEYIKCAYPPRGKNK